MSGGELHFSTDPPEAPDGADFLLKIDFAKNVANPQRVFQAADAMIRALQKLDRILCGSIDSSIKPLMLLEEIETGSVKIWLRNVLSSVDDDALKKLDWKPAIGKYLVRAKYAYVAWTNKEGENNSLADLSKALSNIANETDIKWLPDYAPPPVIELAETTREVQKAKSFLTDKDSISFSAPDEPPVSFNLKVNWSDEELSAFSVKEVSRFANTPMNLIVRRPDYLGSAKWEFRHGRKAISARIEDQEWLLRFHQRRVDVRPGDALRCLVTIEYSYGHDNELVQESYSIQEIKEVLENQAVQGNLLDDQSG